MYLFKKYNNFLWVWPSIYHIRFRILSVFSLYVLKKVSKNCLFWPSSPFTKDNVMYGLSKIELSLLLCYVSKTPYSTKYLLLEHRVWINSCGLGPFCSVFASLDMREQETKPITTTKTPCHISCWQNCIWKRLSKVVIYHWFPHSHHIMYS